MLRVWSFVVMRQTWNGLCATGSAADDVWSFALTLAASALHAVTDFDINDLAKDLSSPNSSYRTLFGDLFPSLRPVLDAFNRPPQARRPTAAELVNVRVFYASPLIDIALKYEHNSHGFFLSDAVMNNRGSERRNRTRNGSDSRTWMPSLRRRLSP
jgi:hypothetical protein